MGTWTIYKWPCSMAMLNYQRVIVHSYDNVPKARDPLILGSWYWYNAFLWMARKTGCHSFHGEWMMALRSKKVVNPIMKSPAREWVLPTSSSKTGDAGDCYVLIGFTAWVQTKAVLNTDLSPRHESDYQVQLIWSEIPHSFNKNYQPKPTIHLNVFNIILSK